MTILEQYRRWFDYEQEMHQAVLDSFNTVPPANQTDPDFHKALDLLAHVAAARLMWLVRFGVTEQGPKNMFPNNCAMDAVAADLTNMHSTWTMYLNSLDDIALAQILDYTANDGKRYRNTLMDILTQLHGHSLYHRGQIAQLIRRLGGVPAITDFVYWAREGV
jgi:uncharacterized damage-inducible protein DinB